MEPTYPWALAQGQDRPLRLASVSEYAAKMGPKRRWLVFALAGTGLTSTVTSSQTLEPSLFLLHPFFFNNPPSSASLSSFDAITPRSDPVLSPHQTIRPPRGDFSYNDAFTRSPSLWTCVVNKTKSLKQIGTRR
jgi:hypothetical protein